MSASLELEDYAVYRAVLLQRFNKSERERFVIGQVLQAWSLRLHGKETVQSKILQWRLKLNGLAASTADDFVKKNFENSSLESKLELPVPYVLLTEAESTEIWSRPDKESLRGRAMDGWKIFRERYPGAGGVITFSRVGFDEHKKQALVEVGIQADWLMGNGRVILLSHGEADWEVSGESRLWILPRSAPCAPGVSSDAGIDPRAGGLSRE